MYRGGRSPSRNPFGAAALRAARSRVTIGHRPVFVPSRGTGQVTPVPEDGGGASQEAALPSLEVPSSPGSTGSVPAEGWWPRCANWAGGMRQRPQRGHSL